MQQEDLNFLMSLQKKKRQKELQDMVQRQEQFQRLSCSADMKAENDADGSDI